MYVVCLPFVLRFLFFLVVNFLASKQIDKVPQWLYNSIANNVDLKELLNKPSLYFNMTQLLQFGFYDKNYLIKTVTDHVSKVDKNRKTAIFVENLNGVIAICSNKDMAYSVGRTRFRIDPIFKQIVWSIQN